MGHRHVKAIQMYMSRLTSASHLGARLITPHMLASTATRMDIDFLTSTPVNGGKVYACEPTAKRPRSSCCGDVHPYFYFF